VRLYGSRTSPFVRKCRAAAIELGLGDRVEFVETRVRPTEKNAEFAKLNPLRKIPALETDADEMLLDSYVICDHLNEIGGGRLIPAEGAARRETLNLHAVASAATEALVSAMYEIRLRPEEKQWPAWTDDLVDRTQDAFDWIEARAGGFGEAPDLGHLAVASLAGYAAFRHGSIDWLGGRPQLAMWLDRVSPRPSLKDTAPAE